MVKKFTQSKKGMMFPNTNFTELIGMLMVLIFR